MALGQPALSLLDVIPVTAHATTEFAYMRQTVRTNNAAVVAEGAVKPTSVYTVNKVPNSLVVVAHLSEGIPRFWLIDQVSLETFVSNELEYGLRLAVEAKVLADVNGTSGIQTQAYATSVLATLRKSLTKLETAGYTPGSLVIHATDWEGVELALSSTNAIEHLALPYDPATRRLFGVPVTTSNAQTAGVGHVLATDAVALDTDRPRRRRVNGRRTRQRTAFGKNLVFARCEVAVCDKRFQPARRGDAAT